MSTRHSLLVVSVALIAGRTVAEPRTTSAVKIGIPCATSGCDSLGTPNEDRADEIYQRSRELIEQGKFDSAVTELDRLIALKTHRTEAGLYWKAYTLAKLGRHVDALATISELIDQFENSRWLKDARALEVQIRQSSGQTIALAYQDDDDLKLMTLRRVMNSNPEQALPVIEKMLTVANSPRVKDRALFVLSQSRSSRALEIISRIAKGSSNPDLQLKAIKYLSMLGSSDKEEVLAEIYRATNDQDVKRTVLRGYMTSGYRVRLFSLAKSEPDQSLRAEAVRLLGVMNARAELSQLYQSESSADVKKQIQQAMFVSGDTDRLSQLARSDNDPELRKTAIRNVGLVAGGGTGEALVSIYNTESNADVRRAVINALFVQGNATMLVALARAERKSEMKREIVSKLMNMKSKAAIDYLVEVLR